MFLGENMGDLRVVGQIAGDREVRPPDTVSWTLSGVSPLALIDLGLIKRNECLLPTPADVAIIQAKNELFEELRAKLRDIAGEE